MQFQRTKNRYMPSLDITPLIDVVFLLLVFLLLTMTFAQDRTDVEEAIIDIELAKSSETGDEKPPETVTILIDETGALYRSDAPVQHTTDELREYLAKKFLENPEISVNVRADHRTRHGDVVNALDIIKALGIKRVQFVIERRAE